MAVFSQANVRMRRFLYRSPRLKTNLTMDFSFGNSLVHGTCRSVSESGVAGTLFDPVPDHAKGLLRLYFRDETLELEAIVESPQADEARLRFALTGPDDLEKARHFVELVSKAGSRVGPVLLP